MPHRENINIVKREKIMAETFGHSNIFATLSPLVFLAQIQQVKIHQTSV